MKGFVLALAVAATLLLVAGCGEPTKDIGDLGYNESAVLKVSVLDSGTVLADGVPATMKDLDDALTRLDGVNGVVWYYRENAKAEGPAIVSQVLGTIMAHKRPISLSSKPDFSDVVDPSTGQSRPR